MATTMAEAFEKAGVKVPPDVFRPTGEVQPYIQLPLDDEVRVYLPDRTPVPSCAVEEVKRWVEQNGFEVGLETDVCWVCVGRKAWGDPRVWIAVKCRNYIVACALQTVLEGRKQWPFPVERVTIPGLQDNR